MRPHLIEDKVTLQQKLSDFLVCQWCVCVCQSGRPKYRSRPVQLHSSRFLVDLLAIWSVCLKAPFRLGLKGTPKGTLPFWRFLTSMLSIYPPCGVVAKLDLESANWQQFPFGVPFQPIQKGTLKTDIPDMLADLMMLMNCPRRI